MKEKLEHRVDDGQALAFLQERHREFLEGIVIEGDDDNGDIAGASEKEPATTEQGVE